MMKKLFATILAITLMISSAMIPSAFAASDEAIKAAEILHGYGLLNGSGTNADGSINYDLDRAPTRYEAVTMLVRLLGKEDEAKSQKWETPFTDLVEWAKPYVGYAYNNGLTSGISATTFGGDFFVNASQYLTFVLRALGYSSEADFSWDKAWELTDRLGITNGEYSASTEFTRGDVAVVSNNALETETKGGIYTLFETIETNKDAKNNDLDISPKYTKMDNYVYYSDSFAFYDETPICHFRIFNNSLYTNFSPRSYSKHDHITSGTLYNVFALTIGMYVITAPDYSSAVSGILRKLVDDYNKMVDVREIEEQTPTGETVVKGYTYEYNGKSITTPDFAESEKTIDGVHFIKMDDTYLVNVNDFLAYFGIDKTLSLETLDGEYCLVIE